MKKQKKNLIYMLKTLKNYQENKSSANELLAVGSKERDLNLPIAEHAAWTIVAQLVINLDATLNKE